MAIVQTLIGNVKGPKGDTGATGATGASGADGAAATIEVGTITTVAYGNPAEVENVGTSSAAVLNFTLPSGPAGATVTDAANLTVSAITASTASFPVPAVGETVKVIIGKINKFFSDVTTALALVFGMKDSPAQNTDFDTILTPGIWRVPSGQGYTNLPTGETSGIMEVFRGNATATYVEQRFTAAPVSTSDRPRIYTRFHLSGGWSPWTRLMQTAPEAVTITAGTGVTVNNGVKYCTRFGQLVWVNAIFTLSSSVNTGTSLFTGLPGVPTSSGSGLTAYLFVRKASDGTVALVYVNSGGDLKNSGAFAADTYMVSGCYRCAP